jgi:hypothetical protein
VSLQSALKLHSPTPSAYILQVLAAFTRLLLVTCLNSAALSLWHNALVVHSCCWYFTATQQCVLQLLTNESCYTALLFVYVVLSAVVAAVTLQLSYPSLLLLCHARLVIIRNLSA